MRDGDAVPPAGRACLLVVRDGSHGAGADTSLVLAQTVPRCTPNRRARATTLTPCARAVRMASTSSSVSRVRGRLVGSADAPISGSSASSSGSASPRTPGFHAETRSTRDRLFPQRSIASTSQTPCQPGAASPTLTSAPGGSAAGDGSALGRPVPCRASRG